MAKHVATSTSCDTCGEYVPSGWFTDDGFIECDSCAEERFDLYEQSRANGFEEAPVLPSDGFILDSIDRAAYYVSEVTEQDPWKLTWRHRVQILLEPLDDLRIRTILRVMIVAHLIKF
jgi:hypothetical protein